MNFLKRFEVGVAEAILLFLVILNILDFTKVLPADLDFIKKIISWTALGYLFYKVSITKILFGTRMKATDCFILTAFFLFIIKNFVGFAISAVHETSPRLIPLYRWLIANASGFEKITFIIAGILLILISIYLTTIRMKKPSLMHLIHEDDEAKGFGKILRFFSIYLVLIAFFVVVFNLAMEWLTMVVDAPLLIFLALLYLIGIVKHKKHFSTASLLYRLGNAGESFYEKFLDLFHEKKNIYLGIAGMLVLHVLTDVVAFLIPHIIIVRDVLYFEQAAATHVPVFILFLKDWLLVSGISKISLFFIYLFNVIGIFLLFLGPVYIWTYAFENRYVKPQNWLLTLYYVCLTSVLILPIFQLKAFKNLAIVGVDVLTHQIAFLSNVNIVLFFSLFMGFFFYMLARKVYPRVRHLAFIIIEIYFAYYIYLFFASIAGFYLKAVPVLLRTSWFIGAYMFLFFMITILFYIGGFLLFVYEAHIKEKI